MVSRSVPTLTCLYHQDETAWLETMAQLVAERRFEELDHENLSEFLLDMARRDKREVLSRLTVLLAHLLKWEHQAEQRSNSWEATILHQRRELHDLLESHTLRNYGQEVLGKAYERAVREAAVEMGTKRARFLTACPWPLEGIVPEP